MSGIPKINDDFFYYTRELYNKGILEVILLFEMDIPIAAGYYFVMPGRDFCMQWIILCSNKRLNLPLDIMSSEEYCGQRDMTFDFGRGAYFYKVHNFKPEIRPLFRLLLSKTLFGNLYIFYKVSISHLRKTIIKYHE